MQKFIIEPNAFLKQNVTAYYHTDYVGYGNMGNPDFINILKNTYNNVKQEKLDNAMLELKNTLLKDLPQILEQQKEKTLTVCVVPRAKTNYQETQVLFKTTVCDTIKRFENFKDGTNGILRYKNTKTTHLPSFTSNYNNDGERPYPGITRDSCELSKDIKNRDILLIDDVYTRNVNIDEDAIQALIDYGASSVIFYCIGKTL